MNDSGFHMRIDSRKENFEREYSSCMAENFKKVRFTYSGSSIEAVLDRLPTAVIENVNEGVYTVSAEVFGKGIEMWLKSQGDMVQILEMR